jgi:hypothetical protein
MAQAKPINAVISLTQSVRAGINETAVAPAAAARLRPGLVLLFVGSITRI